ncbi:MAG: glycosyltransferase family 2 protein [Gammaproteobacteria bacterium]|nr:glycosyltransferase family 2 protein [Gammaproteobacteria bacterium]
MLENITPVILTYNEAANIERTLKAVAWAKRVVVMDSYSSDETQSICARFANVEFYQREFDVLATQWEAAIAQKIQTEWVLALDADYVVSDRLITEMKALTPSRAIGGYRTSFVYKINGYPLKGTLYPPVVALYRLAGASYIQDGHAQRVQVDGLIGNLEGVIFHDDRKSAKRWHQSQVNYSKQEAIKLEGVPFSQLKLMDKIRFFGLGPILAGPYTLFVKGVILDGLPGLKYTWQRIIAEIYLLKARFK